MFPCFYRLFCFQFGLLYSGLIFLLVLVIFFCFCCIALQSELVIFPNFFACWFIRFANLRTFFYLFCYGPCNICCSSWRRTVAPSPKHIHRKYKNIHCIFHTKKVMKITPKSLKLFTIATKELSLLKSYTIFKNIATRSFWTLIVSNSFNLL